MKWVSLTQGKFAIVDDEDFDVVSRYKWHASPSRSRFYAVSYNGGDYVKMHHIIMGLPLKGYVVDHINGNSLLNTRSNLRIVTVRNNCTNLHIEKTSKYPGVYFCKCKKRWRAAVKYKDRRVTLGRYDTEFEAFCAYYAALEYLGDPIPDSTLERLGIVC